LEMMNITWKIPHVTPSDFAKIKMYDIIKSGVNVHSGVGIHMLTPNWVMEVNTAGM